MITTRQCCGWIFTKADEKPCKNCPKDIAIKQAMAVGDLPVRSGDYRNDDGTPEA